MAFIDDSWSVSTGFRLVVRKMSSSVLWSPRFLVEGNKYLEALVYMCVRVSAEYFFYVRFCFPGRFGFRWIRGSGETLAVYAPAKHGQQAKAGIFGRSRRRANHRTAGDSDG